MFPGGVVDRFVIEGVAGKGGMGTVYRARDERTGERVALKVITEATSSARARFKREASALMRVNHPGIVRFVAEGTTPTGEPYLVMNWVDGEDLATRLQRGPLSVREALELARAIANALAALHAQGLVHRDLKPHNILLADRDTSRPVLVDLGIARQIDGTAMTATGSVLGTPQYMAPEQIAGSHDLDRRADLFSLGCVLFEAIAGRALFLGENALAVLAKILVERPSTLAGSGITVAPAVEQLLASLLAKTPSDRPAAAFDVATQLTACLDAVERDRGAEQPGSTRVVTVRENRVIAVAMATGLSGGTDLLATATPEQAARDDEQLRALIGRYDGQLWPLGANRILVTFSGALEASDQASRAARCALALSAAHPEASFALAVGTAQVDRVPVGDVINRVAPVVERARAGHVRVDAASASLLELRFRVEPREADFEVVSELGSAEPPRTLLGRETKCVGRERELVTLLGTLDEVMTDGVSRAVVMTAAAGAGKSRLRHELVQRMQRQGKVASVFVARAEALRADSPLDLLAGLIRAGVGIESSDNEADARGKLVQAVQRRIASEAERIDVAEFLGEIVGAHFPSDSSPRLATARDDTRLMGAQMTRAFLGWVDAESRHRPFVFVLEDLHWGDHQTVRFLDAALRDLPERPFLVLALARPEVHQRFPSLWQSRGVAEIRLAALSARACEEVVRDVLGNVDASVVTQIVKRADGNAFYLEELVRAAAHSDLANLPVSVLAMVQARLEGLDASARRVLRAASVFGETFRSEGTAALVGSPSTVELQGALDELIEREVIVRREYAHVEYVFRHALVREAAYAMLAESDRRTAHGLAAEWLEANGGSDALLLAQHYVRAENIPSATRCFARAARQALDKNDYDAALERGQRVIELGATGSVLQEARAVRGKALTNQGRWAEAEQELQLALAATPVGALEARLGVLRDTYSVGTFRQVSSVLRKAGNEVVTIARQLDRPQLEAEGNAALALADHADERCDEAVERFRVAASRAAERPSSMIGFSSIMLYHVGRHDEAVTMLRHLTTVARDMDDYFTAVAIGGNLGLSLVARGDYAEAREVFADTRAQARQRGIHALEVRTASMAAGHHLDLFDFDTARAAARETCELGEKIEFLTPRISALLDLAFIAVRTGSPHEAQRIVDSIASPVEKGIGFHGWLWRERVGVLQAEIDLALGDFASALRRADLSIDVCHRHRRIKYEAAARIVRAGALVGLGRRDEGVRELATFLDDPAPCEPPARLRVSAALLRHAPDERTRTIAMEVATRIEAGLSIADRPAFEARVADLLRG